MPWYASTAYSNSFAPSYGTPKNFGNLGNNNNLYPRQQSPNFLPPSVYSGVQNNRNFGNLNVPDLSPGFYNSKPSGSYPPYPSNNPSYPAYPSNIPSYPPPKYTSSNTGSSILKRFHPEISNLNIMKFRY